MKAVKYIWKKIQCSAGPIPTSRNTTLTRISTLEFKVTAPEEDYLFDEIGSVLKIKQYQEEKRELLESLELYYRAFFLGEDVDFTAEAQEV